MEWSLATDVTFAYILVMLESIVIGWLIASKHYDYIKMNASLNALAAFVRSDGECEEDKEPSPEERVVPGYIVLNCDDGTYQLVEEGEENAEKDESSNSI